MQYHQATGLRFFCWGNLEVTHCITLQIQSPAEIRKLHHTGRQTKPKHTYLMLEQMVVVVKRLAPALTNKAHVEGFQTVQAQQRGRVGMFLERRSSMQITATEEY